jgi:hypothetical protein
VDLIAEYFAFLVRCERPAALADTKIFFDNML